MEPTLCLIGENAAETGDWLWKFPRSLSPRDFWSHWDSSSCKFGVGPVLSDAVRPQRPSQPSVTVATP